MFTIQQLTLIAMVKFLKGLTNCGLKEAKEAAEVLIYSFYQFQMTGMNEEVDRLPSTEKIRRLQACFTGVASWTNEAAAERAAELSYAELRKMEEKYRVLAEENSYLHRIVKDLESEIREAGEDSRLTQMTAETLIRHITSGDTMRAVKLISNLTDLED